MKGAIRRCDFCKKQAQYIGPSRFGVQAFMCQEHLEKYGLPQTASPLQQLITLTKVCSLCDEEKPIEEFYRYKDSRGVERYRTECKACNLAERKAVSFRRR